MIEEIGSEEAKVALAIYQSMVANTTRRVEPVVKVIIPPSPKAELVKITPAERRKFPQPLVTSDEVFRSRR